MDTLSKLKQMLESQHLSYKEWQLQRKGSMDGYNKLFVFGEDKDTPIATIETISDQDNVLLTIKCSTACAVRAIAEQENNDATERFFKSIEK